MDRNERSDRLFRVAFALTGFFAPLAPPAPIQQAEPPSKLIPGDTMPVESSAIPAETRKKIGAYLLRAEYRLGADDFGLKLPARKQMQLRIRTPAEDDPVLPAAQIYTAGTAALTLYARSPDEVLDGGGAFDPIYSLLDGVAETAWAKRIQVFWWMPNAFRLAVNRHFAQPLLEALTQEEAKDANAPRWPGTAKARKGSLENLPPDHPLVQDRDRILDLLDRYESQFGRAKLVECLNYCNDRALGTPRMLVAMKDLLAPLLAADKRPLLPVVEFATRDPWPGTLEDPLSARVDGVAGDGPIDAYTLELWHGEQRTSPKEFQDWAAGGAPTLLLRNPLLGSWSISAVEVCARRTAPAAPAKDESATRLIWVVVLDKDFHELFRWPFAQSSIPTKANWVRLPLTAGPQLPLDFYFVALEAQDPGPGAKLEICVRSNAVAEHCFRSIPGRRVVALDVPVDFGVKVHTTGRGDLQHLAPKTLIEDLKVFCKKAASKSASKPK